MFHLAISISLNCTKHFSQFVCRPNPSKSSKRCNQLLCISTLLDPRFGFAFAIFFILSFSLSFTGTSPTSIQVPRTQSVEMPYVSWEVSSVPGVQQAQAQARAVPAVPAVPPFHSVPPCRTLALCTMLSSRPTPCAWWKICQPWLYICALSPLLPLLLLLLSSLSLFCPLYLPTFCPVHRSTASPPLLSFSVLSLVPPYLLSSAQVSLKVQLQNLRLTDTLLCPQLPTTTTHCFGGKIMQAPCRTWAGWPGSTSASLQSQVGSVNGFGSVAPPQPMGQSVQWLFFIPDFRLCTSLLTIVDHVLWITPLSIQWVVWWEDSQDFVCLFYCHWICCYSLSLCYLSWDLVRKPTCETKLSSSWNQAPIVALAAYEPVA